MNNKHYYFDLINELPEEFEILDEYLNLVFTETGKENWLDSQFAMTIDEWYQAINKLADTIHTPFNKEPFNKEELINEKIMDDANYNLKGEQEDV